MEELIETLDVNQQVIVSNGSIHGEKIVNHGDYPVCGVAMHFAISYDSDIDAARATIEPVLTAHPHVLPDPEPFVEIETLNDVSVDFLVRPFCEGAHHFELLYSLPEQVKKALEAAGVEIPIPHRNVIVFNGDEPGRSIGASWRSPRGPWTACAGIVIDPRGPFLS